MRRALIYDYEWLSNNTCASDDCDEKAALLRVTENVEPELYHLSGNFECLNIPEALFWNGVSSLHTFSHPSGIKWLERDLFGAIRLAI